MFISPQIFTPPIMVLHQCSPLRQSQFDLTSTGLLELSFAITFWSSNLNPLKLFWTILNLTVKWTGIFDTHKKRPQESSPLIFFTKKVKDLPKNLRKILRVRATLELTHPGINIPNCLKTSHWNLLISFTTSACLKKGGKNQIPSGFYRAKQIKAILCS